MKNLKDEPQHLSEGGEFEDDRAIKEKYDSEPKDVSHAAFTNIVKYHDENAIGKKRARSTSSSDTDTDLLPEKKKWKVEFTDSQLEMLLRHADAEKSRTS